MVSVLADKLSYLAKRVLVDEDDENYQPPSDAELQVAIEQARNDWISANSYFNNATEPDLIDHAIYSIEAAERKYMYLLKCAKKQGLKNDTLRI